MLFSSLKLNKKISNRRNRLYALVKWKIYVAPIFAENSNVLPNNIAI
jgi:hypothetical protein